MQFHPKITAGALAGALTTLIISRVNRYAPGALDAADGASITVILTFITSYFVPSNGADAPPPPVQGSP